MCVVMFGFQSSLTQNILATDYYLEPKNQIQFLLISMGELNSFPINFSDQI